MIDFANIGKYKENNRIEAKRATGGFPQSIWETYSAFANALGGIILLGVEERTDKSLHPVDLPDPEKLIKEFWDIVNNKSKVSVNILSGNDVTIEKVGDKRIVAIRVPRAQRSDKPVYIGSDPFSGSYRRNGEGDYRCTAEEVRSMMRDAEIGTQDMVVLESTALDALDHNSVKSYRARMNACHPYHVWSRLEDTEFLYKLGAVGRSDDGKMHPTAAGLLMFGYEREIVKKFPEYFLDYREQFESGTCREDRIVSSSGDWSGNVYDFYFRVSDRIARDINVPVKISGGDRTDDTPVHKAVREALANCLINADYYGRQGVVIIRKTDVVTLSNPGGFRIDVEEAKSGGMSDPRNGALLKMFNFIGVGKRAGSGIPNIFNVWGRLGWPAPVINESFEPERITLSLALKKAVKKKRRKRRGHKAKTPKTAAYREAIVEYLTDNISAKCSDLSQLTGTSASRTRAILSKMIEDNILVAEGENKNRIYKLKE